MMSRFKRPEPSDASPQQVLDAIGAITDWDWETGYSFAHIVLDDVNLLDRHILYCLHPQWISDVMMGRMDDSVKEHKTFDDLNDHQINIYRHAIEHMVEIVTLLNWLLNVPEDTRSIAEDLHHGTDEEQ